MHTRSAALSLAALALVASLAGCAPTSGPVGDLDTDPGIVSAGPAPGTEELGPDDGYNPPGTWLSLDDDVPSISNLDPSLSDALNRANDAAMADRDLEILLLDGWRSEQYQNHLFEQAVDKYGSELEASRWVKRGTESKHVLGQAVDVATADGMDWLNRFGGEFGLCQIYSNEAWHFELAADESGECPPQLTDGSAG